MTSLDVLDRGVWLPSPEDVVVQKLRWRREKDITDVRNIIAVCRDSLDWDYILRWTDLHGTTDLLDRLQAEAAE